MISERGILNSLCDKEVKGEITEDMISQNFVNFMKDGKGMKHLYKITLLEARYNNFLKRYSNFSHKKKTLLMTKKKCDKKLLTTALEVPNSYIRWIKVIEEGLITCVKNSAIIIYSGYNFLTYDLMTDKWKMNSCAKFQAVDGIGCLEGAKDENLFAYAENCKGSRIFIMTYPELQPAFKLRDNFGGKVTDIHFSGNDTLLVMKCCLTEHYIVIWSWRTSKILFTYPCEKSFLHSEIFRANYWNPSCAFIQNYQDKQVIQFWSINFCGGDSIFINRRSSDSKIAAEIHDMFFDSGNILYLLDSDGNIYTFEYSTGCTKLLIPWRHIYVPVDDIKEPDYSYSCLLEKSKAVPVDYHCDPIYVPEKPLLPAPEPSVIRLPAIDDVEEYDSDEYYEADFPYLKEKNIVERKTKRCHFTWFKNGIVASGPDGRIKYYTKEPGGNEWVKTWGMIPADPITHFTSSQNGEHLIGWSKKYGLVKINPEGTQNKLLHYFGGGVRGMCYLHPSDSFFLTINDEPLLFIWKKKTGRLLNYLTLPCEMDTLLCCFDCPLVVLKSKRKGTLYGVDLQDPRAPVLWPPLALSSRPLSHLTFFYNQHLLAVLDENKTQVIIIKATINFGFEVIATTRTRHKVLNFIGIACDDGFDRGLALLEAVPEDEPPTPQGYTAGKLFDVLRYPRMSVDKTWRSDDFYSSIITGPGIGQVLAVPANKKGEVHNFFVTFKKAGGWRFLGSIQMFHQVGSFDMFIHDMHFVTFGFDGLITCYDADEMFDQRKKPFCVLIPHHRSSGGIRQVIIDYKAHYVISRGADGLVICSRLKMKNRCGHSTHLPFKDDHINVLDTELKHVTNYGHGNIIWESDYEAKIFEKESILAAELLTKIRDELKDIRKTWANCYYQNKLEEPDYRVPWIDLELNKSNIEYLINMSDIKLSEAIRDFENMYYLHLAWNQQWEKLCSNTMSQKLFSVTPFIGRYTIENFNQSVKPARYELYHKLLKTISNLDSAVFPIPKPKILPWNQLDDDEEFQEFKDQKFPNECIPLKDTDSDIEKNTEDQENINYPTKEESEKSEIFSRVPSTSEPAGILDVVKAHQEEVHREMNTDKRKEKEKLIFQELEKIRDFYNEKTLSMKYKKEADGKPFDAWKKQCLEAKSDDDEEKPPKPLESSTYEDDIVEIIKELDARNAPQKKSATKEEVGDGEEVAEGILADAQLENTEGAQAEQAQQLEENNSAERDEEGKKAEVTVEKIEEDTQSNGKEDIGAKELSGDFDGTAANITLDSDGSSTFSWDDIDIGIHKPEEIPKAKITEQETKRLKERRLTEVLEFKDIKKKSVILEVGIVDPMDEPYCMNGAQSLKFVDIDYVRCNEFSLNGLFMADVQISYLQDVIESLENDFNKRFKAAQERKDRDWLRIKKKRADIEKNVDDLVNVCGGSPPADTLSKFFDANKDLTAMWSMQAIVNQDSLVRMVENFKDASTFENVLRKKSILSSSSQEKDEMEKIIYVDRSLDQSASTAFSNDQKSIGASTEPSDNNFYRLSGNIKKDGPKKQKSYRTSMASVPTNTEDVEKIERGSNIDVNHSAEEMSNEGIQGAIPSNKKDDGSAEEIGSELRVSPKTVDKDTEKVADDKDKPVQIEDPNAERVEVPLTDTGDDHTLTMETDVSEATQRSEETEGGVFLPKSFQSSEPALADEAMFEEDNVAGVGEEYYQDYEPVLSAEYSFEEYVMAPPESHFSEEEGEERVESTPYRSAESDYAFVRGDDELDEEEHDKDMNMMREWLEKMMGGAFQLTWQEKLKEEIYVPSVLTQKDPADYTFEDLKLLEQFFLAKAKREKELQMRRKKAENEIARLTNEVQDIMYKNDTDLMNLLKKRMVMECCINSELLKIARLKKRRLVTNRTLENIQHMKDLLNDFKAEGMKLSAISKFFLKKVALLHNEIDKHQTSLKNIDAEFFYKVEPLKLTKKSLEILKNCLKKKPTIKEGENKMYPSELLAVARSLVRRKSLPYFSDASKCFFKSLEDIDSLKNCPSNVDHEVWNLMIDHRHQKIVADLKCRAFQALVAEAEKTAALYYKYFVAHLQRYDMVKCHIRDQKIRLEHHCNKLEFQILLPEGLVESHQTGNIDDFRDCVYLTRKYIENLNEEIVELQKTKEVKWKDFDDYMKVVNSAELLHKELRLRLRVKTNLLQDIKTAKINKYTKEFLHDYQRKQKPVYNVKLLDKQKQEGIKSMVRKSFDRYYRSIQSIKDVKAARDKWISDNMALTGRNNELAAENQGLLETVESLSKHYDDDLLQEERMKAVALQGRLKRRYESNLKKIDDLEAELQALYLKNYPTFSVN